MLRCYVRATSVESDPGKGVVLNRGKPRLKRKSLSLEQTSGRQEVSTKCFIYKKPFREI